MAVSHKKKKKKKKRKLWLSLDCDFGLIITIGPELSRNNISNYTKRRRAKLKREKESLDFREREREREGMKRRISSYCDRRMVSRRSSDRSHWLSGWPPSLRTVHLPKPKWEI